MNDGLDALRDNNKALVLQAADALAKAVADRLANSDWKVGALIDALAAYENARNRK